MVQVAGAAILDAIAALGRIDSPHRRGEPIQGARLDRSSSAFAVSMTANPMTSTGISVSLIRADTVAGDRARISVPSTKISPLIRKTRRNNAPAGVARRLMPPAWSATQAFVHTGRIPPRMGVRPDCHRLIWHRNWPHLLRSWDAYRSADGARERGIAQGHASTGDGPPANRLLSLERRVDELIGERGP